MNFDTYLTEMADALGNQERGICQICGREQAVRNKGNITHHGYTIEYGWFHGTCPGQQHKPLQVDKSETERQIKDITNELPVIEKLIRDLESGKKHPLKVVKSKRGYGRNQTIEWMTWEEAGEFARRDALSTAVYAEKQRLKAGKDTITFLKGLIQTYYGKELKVVEKTEKKKMEVGSVVNIAGHKGVTITKIEKKRAMGVGPFLNGQYLDHAFWMDNGKERSYPLKLARWPK